jgi:hypothetical protein
MDEHMDGWVREVKAVYRLQTLITRPAKIAVALLS